MSESKAFRKSKDLSSNGIKTSFWGPNAWNFLFSTIAGSYPIKYDHTNKDHQRRVRGFIQQFTALKETLPCIYCRQSYARFLKELPIHDYLESRAHMMKWLYLLHDKVNKKLIAQEEECYQSELEKLKMLRTDKKISSSKYSLKANALAKEIKTTKSSPPFISVVAKYEGYRAGCNPRNKKCL